MAAKKGPKDLLQDAKDAQLKEEQAAVDKRNEANKKKKVKK